MKYIIIEQGGLEVAVLFPCFWIHADMLQRFPTAKIISGGILKRTSNGLLYVTSGSISLKLKSRPEDLDIIMAQFNFEM